MLKSLSEGERNELVRFEREFRKGYHLEQRGEFQDAADIYERLKNTFPQFAYIAEERITYLNSLRLHPASLSEETDPWEEDDNNEMSPV